MSKLEFMATLKEVGPADAPWNVVLEPRSAGVGPLSGGLMIDLRDGASQADAQELKEVLNRVAKSIHLLGS